VNNGQPIFTCANLRGKKYAILAAIGQNYTKCKLHCGLAQEHAQAALYIGAAVYQ
jgi:hypothetical protein